MLQEASAYTSSSALKRLEASREWLLLAREFHQDSELEAAIEILNLLEIAVAQSQSLESLYTRLSEDKLIRGAKDVAADAAALAIEKGDVPLAVSLLEQSRAVIFTQLGHYRTALDDVWATAPALAERFVKLSNTMNSLLMRGEMAELAGDRETARYQDQGGQ